MRYAIIGAAAALSSLVYTWLLGESKIGGGGEVVAIAESLASQGTFSDPFAAGKSGPTALAAPVFPAVFAALLKLLGDEHGRQAALVLALIALGLHAVLLIRLSGLLFRDRAPGLWAAGMCIALPAIRLIPSWDALYTADSLMAFCLLSAWAESKIRSAFRRGAIIGMAGGAIALLNPSSLLVSTTWVLFRIGRKWNAQAVRFCIAAALFCFATCLPWALRNQYRLGAPVLKDNFGLTLHASNNDCAASSILEVINSGCNALHNPDASPEELALVQKMGEAHYDTYRRSTAIEWIRSHFSTFLALTGKRVVQFWFPVRAGGLYAYSAWLITALAFGGLVMIGIDRMSAVVFLIMGSLCYSSMYYLMFSDIRYRYPIFWLSLLSAGYFVAKCRQWANQALQPGSPARTGS